jgi:hypothetical protein
MRDRLRGATTAPGHRAVLVGVTTTHRSEIDWLYRGVAPLFPEQWARFRAGGRAAEHDGDLVGAYHRLLERPDPAVCVRGRAGLERLGKGPSVRGPGLAAPANDLQWPFNAVSHQPLAGRDRHREHGARFGQAISYAPNGEIRDRSW